MKIAMIHWNRGVRIPSMRQLYLNIAMFMVVGVLVSRGLLETILPKSVAMVTQLGVVSAVLMGLFLVHIRYFSERSRYYLIFSGCFFLVMAVSSLFTSLFNDFHYWLVYVTFNLYLVFVGLGVVRLQSTGVSPVAFHVIVLFWGWALLFVATLEQVGLLGMPGYSFIGPLIRSASLTGSFLHYPILMALFAYITFQWFSLTKQPMYLFSGLAFCCGPIVVASRSGAFIVIFTVIIAWLVSLVRGEKKALWISLLLLCGVGALALSLSSTENSLIDRLASRIVLAGNLESAGNTGRLHSWTEAVKMWLSSNLLVGEYTGAITNATKNLYPGKSDVAESGVLQQLVNFGLLGLLLFYALLFHVFSYVERKHRLLRYVFLASLTQTLFYQSIEVVPFITLLLFLPWVSDSFEKMTTNQEEVGIGRRRRNLVSSSWAASS